MVDQHPGEISAHDDEVALGEILEVHDAPYQGQSVGSEGVDGADEDAVEQELHIENRRLEQEL